MKFWVGITDKDWFDHLASREPDEVNFWQPSGKPVAQFLQPGSVFLFKLHSPHNYIVGGGYFVRFSVLPARLAWEAFGIKNGVESYQALRDRVARYRTATRGDPMIGCNVLNSPFFWPESEWIPVPTSWAPNIVRGRTYDSEEGDGIAVWRAVEERFVMRQVAEPALDREAPRYGSEYLARARLGQGAFRLLVTDAYQRRCTISGERTLPVLEAAHIKPYAASGPHQVANGLLLRSDLHKLFDEGYLTVTDDLNVEVSQRIRAEFENGREYYRFHGNTLSVLPSDSQEQPARQFLEWHRENIFLG